MPLGHIIRGRHGPVGHEHEQMGAVGEHAGIARMIGYRAAAEDCPEAIERLLRGYLAQRSADENLRAYFRRTSDEELRAQLAGAVVEPVARDPSPGRVPSSVG